MLDFCLKYGYNIIIMVMHKYRSIGVCLSAILLFLTCVSIVVLATPTVFASNPGPITPRLTDIVDVITINVPVSCSMSATGTESHTASVNNGQTTGNIGTTNLKVICNDNSGYAIYAIGYTDDTYGKTVLTSSTLGSTHDITTATTVTTGTSSWAMKLASVSGTYAPIIAGSTGDSLKQTGDPDFSDYTAVPQEYAKVAYHTSSTDTGNNATGSNLTTTYRAYISPTQPAGTYVGQVKYTLVHPSFVTSEAIEDAVTVNFNGNGLTFPNGSSTNQVKYAMVCEPGGYGYVGSNYQEVMTSNITTGGTQNGPYTDSESVLQTLTLPNADKVKVVVEYGITADTIELAITKGTSAVPPKDAPAGYYEEIYDMDNNLSGTDTYIFDGDTVTININSWDTPATGYDKGFYVKVYPVYDTEQANTTREKLPDGECSIRAIQGSYAETTTWNGKWIATINEEEVTFEKGCLNGGIKAVVAICPSSAEEDLYDYLIDNYDSVKGTTLNVNAYNPYYLRYNGNGASSEFGMGIHQKYVSHDGTYDEELVSGADLTLVAPNYKRVGYGFIGWSTDANAASRLNTATLYGPNQTITINDDILNTVGGDHIVNLYAIWLPSAGNIQNWSGCSSMSIGGVTALTDTRDNDTYAVAKLADGNCWMIENLRLGGNSPITLTTADSQSAGVLPAASTATSWGSDVTSQNVNAQNTLSPDQLVTAIYSGGRTNNYSYGNYYSWAAAINTTAQINTSNTTVNTSICPAGWILPSSDNYQYLISTINDSNSGFTTYPNNFVLSGYADSGVYHTNVGSYLRRLSEYWTATTSTTSSNYAYYYFITGSRGYISDSPSTSSGSPNKTYGRPVRCMVPPAN